MRPNGSSYQVENRETSFGPVLALNYGGSGKETGSKQGCRDLAAERNKPGVTLLKETNRGFWFSY